MGDLPWLFFKGRTCERFHWDFEQFDAADAGELLQYLRMDRLVTSTQRGLEL